jgi:hypothetical protein
MADIVANLRHSAMDFFDRQEHARRQTRLLLAYFAAAVVVIIVLTYFIFASVVLPFLKPLPHGPRINSIPIAICHEKERSACLRPDCCRRRPGPLPRSRIAAGHR